MSEEPPPLINDIPLADHVRQVLSKAEFVRLAEELGGVRIYVPRPNRLSDDHDLVLATGWDAAERISRAIGGEWFAVPLARLECARFYEKQGLKDHQIARKLRMTRFGVQRLLDRAVPLPDSEDGANKPEQISLF